MCIIKKAGIFTQTWKGTETTFQKKSFFSIKTTKFFMKYNLLCFQISGRLIIFFTKHDC